MPPAPKSHLPWQRRRSLPKFICDILSHKSPQRLAIQFCSFCSRHRGKVFNYFLHILAKYSWICIAMRNIRTSNLSEFRERSRRLTMWNSCDSNIVIDGKHFRWNFFSVKHAQLVWIRSRRAIMCKWRALYHFKSTNQECAQKIPDIYWSHILLRTFCMFLPSRLPTVVVDSPPVKPLTFSLVSSIELLNTKSVVGKFMSVRACRQESVVRLISILCISASFPLLILPIASTKNAHQSYILGTKKIQ